MRPAVPRSGPDGSAPAPDPSQYRLLTVRELASTLAVSVRSVWRMSATGQLPPPLRLGPKTVCWRLADVREYLAEL